MKTKTKILFFQFDLGNGGAEKVLVNLVNNLPIDKYEITIKTLFDFGCNREFIANHVKYEPIFRCSPFRGISPLLELFSPKLLHSLFIRKKYDIEIGFREGIPNRVISGCRDKEVRTYGWIHLALTTPAKVAQGFRSLNEMRRCHRKLTATAAVSDFARDTFLGYFKKSVPTIETVHNVVERDRIVELSKQDIPIILDHNKVNLCSVGRLTSQKSFDRLLQALSCVRDSGFKAFHLYILGQGELRHNLESLAAQLDLSKNVTFLGYDTNPYRYVSKMDLFVCSSLNEGYSTAVTESIIVGTPVLTTDCSGMSEIIGDSNAGIIVENCFESLLDGLINLLPNRLRLLDMRMAAVSRSSYFSMSKAIEEFEKFINREEDVNN